MLRRLILNNRSFKLTEFVRKNSNFVKINDEGIQRRITMCNDKTRNSLGLEMIRSLQSAVDTIDFEKCRVLVLSSNHEKIFSAGHNLKELTTENGNELHKQVFNEFTELCLNLKRLQIPVIAEVKGKFKKFKFILKKKDQI